MHYRIMTVLFIAGTVLSGACSSADDDKGGGKTGASGVTSTTKATNFSATEKQSFCEWLIEITEPKVGEYQCGSDITVTIEPFTVAECEMELANNPGCPVSSLEGCFEAIADDPCLLASASGPPACAALSQCAQDASNNVTTNNVTTNNVTPNNTSTNSSTSTFCYDHDCNGDTTGEQCFSTQDAYCTSLCNETNCISVAACEAECS